MSSKRTLYILCGGQSRRMGRDKARIKLDGVALLERVIKKGERHFDEVVLLSGGNHYDVSNRQLVDKLPDAGPLSGLLEALKDSNEAGLNQCGIIPVDLPNVSVSTVEKLANEHLGGNQEARLLASVEGLQPLAGIYSTGIIDRLQVYLNNGNRMVFGFVNQLNYSTITVNEQELKNINRPDDLKN